MTTSRKREVGPRVRNLFLLAGESAVDDPLFAMLSVKSQEEYFDLLADEKHPLHEERRKLLGVDKHTVQKDNENLSKIKAMDQEGFQAFIAAGDFGYVGLHQKMIEKKKAWLERCWESHQNRSFAERHNIVYVIFILLFLALYLIP